MNKARLDFCVDLAIGLAGAISAMSGLLLLWPGDLTAGILGVSLRAWSAVHTWSSLAAVAGVGLHLALHWSWMAAMTRRVLLPAQQRQPSGLGSGEAHGAPISRRAFLAIGRGVAVAAGLAAAGYKAIASAVSAGDGQGTGTTAGIAQQGGVA